MIRFMTAGQSWIRYGICRTSRSLQHSVTRVSYGIELKNVWASASTTPIATTVSSPRAMHGKLLFIACGRSRRFARVRRRVQDMASFMRSHLLGSYGAMQGGHRKRSDAPVRDVQAHAWQQRLRRAASREGTGIGDTNCLHTTFHTLTIFLSWASGAEEGGIIVGKA